MSLEQAADQGARDAKAQRPPAPPRDGPRGSHAHGVHLAYLQGYRDQAAVLPTQRNPRRESIPGTRAVAARIVNAEREFVRLIMERGFTREEAEKAMRTMLRLRVAKLDPIGGTIRVTHGAFLDPPAIRKAVNYRARGANPRRKHSAKWDRCVTGVKRKRGKGRRVRSAEAICTRALGPASYRRINRYSNPRPRVALYAQRPGGPLLKFTGKKFARRGRAELFDSPQIADNVGATLRALFPQSFKGYKLFCR